MNASDALDMHKKHSQSKTRPTLHDFSDILQRVVRCFSRTYVVVDALDECSDIDEHRETFVGELIALLPSISLFIVSRPLPHLEQRLQMAILIELKAIDEDIMAYVRASGNVSETKGPSPKDPGLLETTVTGVTAKTKGMFSTARLYVDSILTMITPGKAKAALERLPEGLN